MSAVRGKGSARKSKQMTVKTSLNNPYAPQWCPLCGEDMHFVLRALEEIMKQNGFKKVEDRKRMKGRSGKMQKEQSCAHPGRPEDGKEADNPRRCGWTDLRIRKQLAIGINEVTKALEKNELRLLLVCKSAKPALLTAHLIPLSASRAVPAGQVPRLSETLAPVLGLTSVLALGFKRNTDAFAEVAEMIVPRIPSLDVPWIQHGTEQPLGTQDTDLMNVSAEEFTKSTTENSPKLKRKRTNNGAPASPNVALQTLKVKNIVPNPNKSRKLPKTKKRISK